MPYFSIIIPLYNCANTLNNTLQSISAQTFDDYELVLVDGGSTDDTLRIITDFKNANSPIKTKLLSEPDKGIYDAMNKGVDMAAGQRLYFMGGDDRFRGPDVLAAIMKALEQEDADLIYGNVEGISSKINYKYDTESKVLSKGIHHQSAFYKSSLFQQIGKYDLRFPIAADYHFTLKVFLNDHYRKRYVDLNIALYGEGGYSSQQFDYKFFSGHYRMLAAYNGTAKLADPQECLDNSIYCCLYLAGKKKELAYAWSNLLYYLTCKTKPHGVYKAKIFLRMLMWTLKPA